VSARRSAEFRRPYGQPPAPLPLERRLELPFVIDVEAMRLIAPWSAGRPHPGDVELLDAMHARLDLAALPASLCWAWVDKPPQPLHRTEPGWLANWSRGKAVYRLAP
jgi:hypothetical protein